jgi:alkylhydroperoxidase family enzyme
MRINWYKTSPEGYNAMKGLENFVELERLFKPGEIVELTFAIVAINSWNRLSIYLRINN